MRTKSDIAKTYREYLIEQGKDKKVVDTFTDDEILEIVVEKCYGTEEVDGKKVSSVDAWWHFCNIIIHVDPVSTKTIWNKFVKDVFEIMEQNTQTCFIAARGLGKCTVKGQEVLLVDGLRKIEDVRVGDELYRLDDCNDLKLMKSTVTGVKDVGNKQTFAITTSSGRMIEVSKDHPFYTTRGWMRISDGLKVGDFVATPVNMPFGTWHNMDYAVLAGLMISEGCFSSWISPTFTNSDLDLFNRLFYSCDNLKISHGKIRKTNSSFAVTLNRPGFYELFPGLKGTNSYNQRVPNKLFTADKDTVSTFLRYLYEGDGNVENGGVSYTSMSRKLLEDVQLLLRKFGIVPNIKKKEFLFNGKKFVSHRMYLGGESTIKFMNEINFVSERKRNILKSEVDVLNTKNRNTNVNVIPFDFLEERLGLKAISGSCCLSKVSLKKILHKWYGLIDSKPKGNNLNFKNKLLKNVDILDYAEKLIDSDIHWEKIVSIRETGMKPCYDLEVDGGIGNYIAEGIYVHNSYITFVLYPLFKTFLFKNTDVLIVTNIPKMARRNLRVLKRIVDENELLLEKKDMSNLRELKWGDKEVVYNEGMIETLSIGTTPRSAHVPIVILDDPLRDDNKYSDDYILNFVRAQLLPCVKRLQGRLIVNGTPMSTSDVFHRLMNTDVDGNGTIIRAGGISALGFYSKAFPAITDMSTKEVYMPEVYTWNDLMEIKAIQGDIVFTREYMVNVVSDDFAIFPEGMVKKCTKHEFELESVGRLNATYVIGVDLATSASKTADYSAFCVLEYDVDKGVKILRAMVNERMTAEEQEKTLISLARKFNNAFVYVEKNNIGEYIRQKLENNNIYCDGFSSTKESKSNAVKFLRSEMANRRIFFPEWDGESDILKKQLINYGYKVVRGKKVMCALTGHDDMVSALFIANLATQQMDVMPSEAVLF